MTWTNDQRLYAIKVHTATMSSAQYISGVLSGGISNSAEKLVEQTAGNIYPASASLVGQRLIGRFTTVDVAKAIEVIGLGGAGDCITFDASHPGVDLFFAKQACNAPAAGAVHTRYNVTKGLFVPRTLTCEHRKNATISYDIYAAYDGVNLPVTKTTNNSLPSGAIDPGFRYSMATASIGGVDVEGKQSITINFGSDVTNGSADGSIYDSVLSLQSIKPMIAFSGVEPNWFSTVAGLAGTVVQDSNSFFTMARRNALAATAVHIKISFSGLVTWETLVDGTPDGPATAAFNVDTHIGSTGNNPLLADTAFAF